MQHSLSNKKVCLRYFSYFSELTGKVSEEYKTEASTLESLWYELDRQYGFGQPITAVRPVINHQFCDWQDTFKHGDNVSFIPPVSGG